MKFMRITAAAFAMGLLSGVAHADGHAQMMVMGEDQDMSGGKVTASKVMAGADGWLVVHKTEDGTKPGPVIGHAALKEGENTDVTAELTEEVKPGEKVMLMLHGEDGGTKAGEFEYTLGAKEDGPVKVDDKLVMAVVTAK